MKELLALALMAGSAWMIGLLIYSIIRPGLFGRDLIHNWAILMGLLNVLDLVVAPDRTVRLLFVGGFFFIALMNRRPSTAEL